MPLLRQAIWGDIWKHTVGKSETNAASVTLPALPQVLWGDIWRGTVQCRKEKREKSTFVIFSRCSERMCPLETYFSDKKDMLGKLQHDDWWGQNVAQSSSLVWFVSSSFSSAALLITTLFLSSSSTSLPMLSSSSFPNTELMLKSTRALPFHQSQSHRIWPILHIACRAELWKWGWEQWKRTAKSSWETEKGRVPSAIHSKSWNLWNPGFRHFFSFSAKI